MSGRTTARWMAAVLLVAGCSASSAGPEPIVTSTSTTTPAPTTTTTGPRTTTTTTTTTVPGTTTTTASATTTTSTTEPLPPLQGLGFEVVASGLAQPVFVTSAPGDPRLFVLERTGVVRTIGPDTTVTAEPYLDLRGVVGSSSIEQGLLGLAFHPGFEENGRLFVYYTLPSDDSRLVEFAAAPGATTVDASTGRVVLEVEQPAERHNGGMIVFGPEGLLYLSLGDGGSGGEHGQRTDTVLGSILRLDVDRGDPYAIPAGNPFAAGGGAPEIWAYGMRNPWRFSIDPIDRLVYVGDVGQEDREEIDVLSLDGGAGSNLGWRVMEGSRCFAGPCDPAGFVLPVVEYGHDEGCSVTGGHVYRGAAIPELDGHYFYADWCRGWVRSFRYAGGAAVDQTDWSADLEGIGQVNGWGIGPDGELYAATWGGTVVRLVAVR